MAWNNGVTMVPEVLRSSGCGGSPEVQFDLNQLFQSTSESGHYRSPFVVFDSGDGCFGGDADFGGVEADVFGLGEPLKMPRSTLMDGSDDYQSMDMCPAAPRNVTSGVDSLWDADCTTVTSSSGELV